MRDGNPLYTFVLFLVAVILAGGMGHALYSHLSPTGKQEFSLTRSAAVMAQPHL